jgi:putative colanic acid biosynthesis UDP-glucose lipid carrier transferase
VIGFFLAYLLRFDTTLVEQAYLIALLITLVLSALVLPSTGAFRDDFELEFARVVRRLISGWVLVLLITITIAALTKTTEIFSRIWFGYWAILGTVGLVIAQFVSYSGAKSKRRARKRSRNIVLVGSGEAALRVEQEVEHNPSSEMKIVQRFGNPWSEAHTLPITGLSEFLEGNGVKAVWIAVPWDDKTMLSDALHQLRDSVVDVIVVPDLDQYRLLNQNVTEWAGMPVINLAGTPMTNAEMVIKSVMDRIGSLALLILLSPILLMISISILLTDGRPILYKQHRNGIGGESITALKFRTMRNSSGKDDFSQAVPGDERVTALGRFLRKTSLDELPQLMNVLKGEMSLVGPRPHPVELNEQFKQKIPKYMLRHKVKPGITGWAQVNGYRGRTETKEIMARRIEYDLWYIQNWSLYLDLKILFMTPFSMVHQNAY